MHVRIYSNAHAHSWLRSLPTHTKRSAVLHICTPIHTHPSVHTSIPPHIHHIHPYNTYTHTTAHLRKHTCHKGTIPTPHAHTIRTQPYTHATAHPYMHALPQVGGPMSDALVEAFSMCELPPEYDFLEASDSSLASNYNQSQPSCPYAKRRHSLIHR